MSTEVEEQHGHLINRHVRVLLPSRTAGSNLSGKAFDAVS